MEPGRFGSRFAAVMPGNMLLHDEHTAARVTDTLATAPKAGHHPTEAVVLVDRREHFGGW
jgi:hypothetical protein